MFHTPHYPEIRPGLVPFVQRRHKCDPGALGAVENYGSKDDVVTKSLRTDYPIARAVSESESYKVP